MSDNIFIQSNTPWYSGIYRQNDTNLNLAQLDTRYLRISGGTVSGLTTFLAGANVIGQLSINGSPIDLSFISGVVAGTASANKALVVDSSRDLTNLNKLQLKQILTKTTNLTLNPVSSFCDAYDMCISNANTAAGLNTGLSFLISTLTPDGALPGAAIVASRITQASCDLKFYTSQTLRMMISGDTGAITGISSLTSTNLTASSSIDGVAYSLAGSSLLMTALTDNAAGTAIAGKALVIDSSRNIRIPTGSSTSGCFRWYNDTPSKEDLVMYRPDDDTGLVIATNPRGIQKSSPLLWLYSGLNLANAGAGTSSAEYKEVIRSNHKLIGLSDNYQSGWFHGYLQGTPPWKASGFQYCTQFYTSMEALNITCGTSSTNSITTSNNILMQNNGKIYFNTTNRSIQSNTTFLFNGSSVVRGLGDWLAGTSQVVQEWRNSNNATIMRMYIPNTGICDFGTQSNDGLSLMTNNTRRMTITNAGRVGINNDIPTCGLDVATGENSVLFTNNIMVNTYSYAISSNTHTNFGGGPFSASICARFRGSVWIQDRLWATSDRRLKKDISSLDFSLEHYKKLNPVSYKWKNSDNIQLGLIAQDVKDVCSEAVSIVANDNMKVEKDGDIEGAQYTVDYNAINMMNVVAIQKLIKRIEQLEAIIDKSMNKKK